MIDLLFEIAGLPFRAAGFVCDLFGGIIKFILMVVFSFLAVGMAFVGIFLFLAFLGAVLG